MAINQQHDDYLRAALTSMARHGERSRHWGDGHWGAAVAAGCFFVEDSVADDECSQGVERQLARFTETYADRFAPPFDRTSPASGTVDRLLDALGKNIDRLCYLIGHLLDFSQALNLLHDLGFADLFARALPPLRRFIFVLRSSQNLAPGQPITLTSPVDRLPLQEARPVTADPLTGAYWRRDFAALGWDGGHAFKFPYAYFDHARRVDPDLRRRSYDNFKKILGGSCRESWAA